MDKNLKVFFGKILGEIYRLQKDDEVGPFRDDATMYGLLNGIECVIDDELEKVGWISTEKVDGVMGVLENVETDDDKNRSFKGYYDIENDLKRVGVTRGEAIRILEYLYANGQYQDLIRRMDGSNSPTECRNLTDIDF